MSRRKLLSGLLTALLLFTGCAVDALLVADPYWAPILQGTQDGRSLIKKVRKETGLSVEILDVPPGAPGAELLENYLRDRTPERILLGAFAAVEMEGLAERRPETLFFCLDAPPEPPLPSAYVWVRFDPIPALQELAQMLRHQMGEGEAQPLAAFLDPHWGALFVAAAKKEGLPLDIVELGSTSSMELVRSRVQEKIATAPPLAIVFAGTRTAAILELLRKAGPLELITVAAGSFPREDPLQVQASLEKDYFAAIVASLTKEAQRGEIIKVPMIWTGKLFDKGK